jgi:hypothetical protein
MKREMEYSSEACRGLAASFWAVTLVVPPVENFPHLITAIGMRDEIVSASSCVAAGVKIPKVSV